MRARRRAGALAAGLVAVGVVAGASRWPSSSDEPVAPSAATAAPEVSASGTVARPHSPEGPTESVPLDPDAFLPPLSIPEPGRRGIAVEVVRGRPALENVQGIVVHQRLAPFIRTLLAEAEVAGVQLEGGGYRDAASQRRLRAQNCPDPVNSAPSSCSPPTARVGESMHEYGLAVDFTSDGELIVNREHPAYRFLEANAPGWGIEVHPQEPWHWSFGGG